MPDSPIQNDWLLMGASGGAPTQGQDGNRLTWRIRHE
jgi:hypothetical protein